MTLTVNIDFHSIPETYTLDYNGYVMVGQYGNIQKMPLVNFIGALQSHGLIPGPLPVTPDERFRDCDDVALVFEAIRRGFSVSKLHGDTA